MDTFLCLAPPAHIIQSFISIIRRIKPNRSISVPNKVHEAIQSKGICLSLHFKLHGPFNTTFRNSCSLALGCILFEECVCIGTLRNQKLAVHCPPLVWKYIIYTMSKCTVPSPRTPLGPLRPDYSLVCSIRTQALGEHTASPRAI